MLFVNLVLKGKPVGCLRDFSGNVRGIWELMEFAEEMSQILRRGIYVECGLQFLVLF